MVSNGPITDQRFLGRLRFGKVLQFDVDVMQAACSQRPDAPEPPNIEGFLWAHEHDSIKLSGPLLSTLGLGMEQRRGSSQYKGAAADKG